jgi:hypothetical protein
MLAKLCSSLPSKVGATQQRLLHFFDDSQGQLLWRNGGCTNGVLVSHVTARDNDRPRLVSDDAVGQGSGPRFRCERWVDCISCLHAGV